MNTGATFQRAMDHSYHDLIGKTMVDYQNDLTIYSKVREQHVFHIKEFLSCRMYGIFINPPQKNNSITYLIKPLWNIYKPPKIVVFYGIFINP
jgi:hypothetical protein